MKVCSLTKDDGDDITMAKALCIIDMQYHFYAARSTRTARAVCREVRQAKENGWPILLVEYRMWNPKPTRPMILKEIGDYPKYHHVMKAGVDGSTEILAAMSLWDVKATRLRVCGVETNVCIRETIKALRYKRPEMEIELVADACNSARHSGAKDPIERKDAQQAVQQHLFELQGVLGDVEIV
jgi:hypothetical protein